MGRFRVAWKRCYAAGMCQSAAGLAGKVGEVEWKRELRARMKVSECKTESKKQGKRKLKKVRR